MIRNFHLNLLFFAEPSPFPLNFLIWIGTRCALGMNSGMPIVCMGVWTSWPGKFVDGAAWIASGLTGVKRPNKFE